MHRIKPGYVPETREPDRIVVTPEGVTVRVFLPDIDEAERQRRKGEYLRVATEIHRRAAERNPA